MAPYAYQVVNVFTTVPAGGNPLAVFPDARGLDDATMQRIAHDLNLSETTFVFPSTDPACAGRVRIFTPASELNFAGHPTIGTAYVLRGESNAAEVILEENIGKIPVRVSQAESGATQFWFTTPPPITFREKVDKAIVARSLGLAVNDMQPDATPEVGGVSAFFLYAALRNRGAVDRAVFNPAILRSEAPEIDAVKEIFIFAPLEESDGEPGDTWAVYSRMFAPDIGIGEDPATGSATGPLAAYMIRSGMLPLRNGLRMVSEQGTKMGARSLIHVRLSVEDDGTNQMFDIGGSVVPMSTNTITI